MWYQKRKYKSSKAKDRINGLLGFDARYVNDYGIASNNLEFVRLTTYALAGNICKDSITDLWACYHEPGFFFPFDDVLVEVDEDAILNSGVGI